MEVPTLRILIVDDHKAVRDGLRLLLETTPGWHVCGEASTGREGVALSCDLKPDVVVLDVMLGDMSGIDVLAELKRSSLEVEAVIFTAHEDEDLVAWAFEVGAKSFLLKTDESDRITSAITAAGAHKPYFTAWVAEIIYRKLNEKKCADSLRTSGGPLTKREKETLRLVAEGYSNKEVAGALGVSVRTAESHRAALMRKLGLNSVGDVVRFAVRHHLIKP